jgi:hypothetical protein
MTVEMLKSLTVGSNVVTNKGVTLTVTKNTHYEQHADWELGTSAAFSSMTLTAADGKIVHMDVPSKLAAHLAPQLEVANA